MNDLMITLSLALAAFSIWLMLFRDPASDRAKARLISEAANSAEASEHVRKVLAKKNLQNRHCYAELDRVRAIIKREEAKRVIEIFNSRITQD